MQHASLENGRWADLSFPQQMANIGSETSRVDGHRPDNYLLTAAGIPQ